MGSLFDGIGGFPLAALHNGITPAWASEIEGFPIQVTKRHFPQMIHLGDIKKLHGAGLPPVDLICGGTPCQNFSVAAPHQTGLAGERSSLFWEFVRVIQEMREYEKHTGKSNQLIRPRYVCWENVPGVFSANKRKDFRIILEQFCKAAGYSLPLPEPPGGKWLAAGTILGDTFSLAWRVLDAQYWPGTPQRRKRIYLVLDFAGQSAGKILFEQEGLPGSAEPCGTEGKGSATLAVQGAADTGGYPLSAGFSPGQGAAAGGTGYQWEQSPTLKAASSGTNQVPAVLQLYENHGIDARYRGPLPVAPTIAARYGTGGGNTPLWLKEDAYCISGNILGRKVENGGHGLGVQPNISYTLTATDRPAVYARQRFDSYEDAGTASTETASQYKGPTDLVCADFRNGRETKQCGTLQSKSTGGYSLNAQPAIREGQLIRRLTPLECERLQGFPDGWTYIPGATDSKRYKTIGNSIAIPCADYVLRRIAYFLRKERE